MKGYIDRAKRLLASAKSGQNPFDGWSPGIPEGVNLEPLTDAYSHYEQLGLEEVGLCGFVLVAGGLGERLAYNGIKIELPTQTVTGTCYLEHYCKQILAMQKKYGKGIDIPLAIMVSDDTATKTEALLERNSYFGMKKEQITLMKQGKVPALMSNAAHIALNEPYVINAKPHGHGDVHSLMHSTGTAKRWLAAGTRWVVFFQDTNALSFYTLPAMLGVSITLQLDVNSLAVKRFAKQSVGAITKLTHNDGREMTINVEYNQLDPLLRATVSTDGDVNDPTTGYSPYPGNINQLLFKLEPYCSTLERTTGLMPEFVNPKYADATKSTFKKPTRLECMMQDYPKVLKGGKVGFTTAPAWICYSPCKNNTADAAASIASGVPAASAYTAECDQYGVFVQLLSAMGASIAPAAPYTVLGITASPGPRLIFDPSFVLFPCELAKRFPRPDRVRITARSTLVVEGDVLFEALLLNGSLRAIAGEGSKLIVKPTGVMVENEGHVLKLLGHNATSSDADGIVDNSVPLPEDRVVVESDTMRGYIIVEKDVLSAEVSCNLGNNIFTGVTVIEESAYEPEEHGEMVDQGSAVPQQPSNTFFCLPKMC